MGMLLVICFSQIWFPVSGWSAELSKGEVSLQFDGPFSIDDVYVMLHKSDYQGVVMAFIFCCLVNKLLKYNGHTELAKLNQFSSKSFYLYSRRPKAEGTLKTAFGA